MFRQQTLLLQARDKAFIRLFNTITGPGSRIAFTYIPTGKDGRPDAGRWTGLILWLLKAGGEPWLWSTRPEGLTAFLEEAGWTSAPDLVGSTAKHGVEVFGVAMR